MATSSRPGSDDLRPAARSGPEPLWRELTGRVLRRCRLDRGERLVETAARAGVSSQYLSELERGRKDASSELLAAVTGALGLTLLDLTRAVAVELVRTVATPASTLLRSIHDPIAAPGALPGPGAPHRFSGPVALAA